MGTDLIADSDGLGKAQRQWIKSRLELAQHPSLAAQVPDGRAFLVRGQVQAESFTKNR